MILDKVIEEFDKVDQYYLEVYDKAKNFNKKTTAVNKKELESALRLFKKHFKRYESDLQNLWISDKWEG